MSQQQKIMPLTSLRFFAAFYVVLYHTADSVFVQARDLATVHGRVLDMGYIAVSFFFTLSGYILAVTYLPRNTSKREFWWARFSRVYPLFLLTLLLDLPQYLAGVTKQIGFHDAVNVTLARLVENMAMLQAWVPRFRAMDGPNWSLSVETVFYFVFPFLAAAIARWTIPRLAAAGVLSYVLGLAGVAMAMQAHLSVSVLKYDPALHLHEFIFGALLGAARLKFSSRIRPKYAPVFLLATVVCFSVVVGLYNTIPMPFIHDGLLVPAFACAIIAFHSGQNAIDRLFSAKWLVVLGEASYGLYLIHLPLWHILFPFRLHQSRVMYVGYLLATVLLSVVSFYYVETPVRRLLTNKRRMLTPAVSAQNVVFAASYESMPRDRQTHEIIAETAC
jgi:peptidoglycan/LPS O-acetylase OafA/YrhL